MENLLCWLGVLDKLQAPQMNATLSFCQGAVHLNLCLGWSRTLGSLLCHHARHSQPALTQLYFDQCPSAQCLP